MRTQILAHALLTRHAESDETCFLGDGFCLSFRDVAAAVLNRASWLERGDVGRGDRVVLAMLDSPELAIQFYACLAIGALPAVLNPRLDAAYYRFTCDDLQPALCLIDPGTSERWPRSVPTCAIAPGSFRGWLGSDGQEAGGAAFDAAVSDPDAPALIQYTSGSTGQPKGVVLTARAVIAACRSFAEGALRLGTGDRIYSVPKAFFGFGQGNSLFFGPYCGASTILDAAWPTAEHVMRILEDHGPTTLFAVPTIFRMLLDGGLRPDRIRLRHSFSAGAPLPPDLARLWEETLCLPLHNGIGATELTHVFATTCPDARRPNSVGRMLPGLDARILDACGNDCPAGVAGVLHVRSATTAHGYWRRPDEQARRFRDGWYRTGDILSRDAAGLMWFHGREDDRFKVKGRWVSPVEVEVAISARFPGLGDVFVVPADDGRGEVVPALVLRTAPPDGLLDAVAARLAGVVDSYKVPVRLLVMSVIPINGNGKPDRAALARLTAAAQPSLEIT